MKSCHDDNGTAIYVGRGATVHNPLFKRSHYTVEYLNMNVSIGQLIQHISKSIAVCARSRPNMLTKNLTSPIGQSLGLDALAKYLLAF